jgi:hypothetical protein
MTSQHCGVLSTFRACSHSTLCLAAVFLQGYTSSSSTRSGTVSRTAVRYGSVLDRWEAQRVIEQQPGPSRSLQDLLAQLEVCGV